MSYDSEAIAIAIDCWALHAPTAAVDSELLRQTVAAVVGVEWRVRCLSALNQMAGDLVA